MSGDLEALARICTAAGYIAEQAAATEEPEALRTARRTVDDVKGRLIGVLGELRGIECDLDVIDRSADDHPAIEATCRHMAANARDDLGEATEAVVDLLVQVQWHSDRLAQWKPEDAPET